MRRLLPVLLCIACSSEPDKSVATPEDASGGTTEPSPFDGDPADPLPSDPLSEPSVSTDPVGDADARPTPEDTHRAIKRMNLEQLSGAMQSISGGIAWSEGDELYWDTFGETLGVADYQTRLRDNLDASIMFQKFLDDASVHTCDAWVAGEAEGDTRRFFSAAEPDDTDPTTVAANLVALRLLIHGRQSAPEDPIIVNYGAVFETVLRRTDDPIAAWTTVCVGFFTHPDFYTY